MDKEIDLEKKIKELDNIVYKVGQSAQTVLMLTNPQVFYDDTHKQALGYQNLFYLKKAQRIKPTLYDGSVISRQHVVIPMTDEEETLILEKDTTINKLRNHIKSLRESDKKDRVKQDMDEIKIINIELEHSVTKLLSENELLHKEIEHLKKGQIQEKVFVTTILQNELRRLKGKNVLDNATTLTNATTIAPGMFKLDLEPLSPKLLNNREAHIHYLQTTKEQADILLGIVE
ncbi:hypothetical protein Tco_1361001 [Tanacetum coccineum]